MDRPEPLDVGCITSGATVAVGGYLEQNVPVDLLLAVADAGVRDLTVVAAPSASLGVDLLVAAGVVSRVICPYVGFEGRGAGPALQREVAAGRVERELCDQEILVAGLRAAAQGCSCAPVLETGSDSVHESPRVRSVRSPFDGSPLVLAEALPVDVTLLHAQIGDQSRNLAYWGSPFLDLMFAQASRRVLATVDTLVPVTSLAMPGPTISGIWVDSVVARPGGAWPTASHGTHPEDKAAVEDYLRLEKETAGAGVDLLRAHRGVLT
ncbi:CoA transferase subunit A [Pseudonocardia dioxanivorans]|uniref:CoA transferase subunit A n=1 Tax=Pseudonocardia dioxanivorans TaxID=240495 RepID=UPI00131A4CBE|nr:CoA-transferase [Pseudonocardia dioxanivorans]